MSVRLKDPQEVIDFSFDWDDAYLGAGESISSFSFAITPQSGASPEDDLEIDGTPTRSGAVCTAFVRGGVAGRVYRLSCKVVTDEGRTAERSVPVRLAQL